MQLFARELEPAFLAALGEEARQLLCAGDIYTLAARFGYALAFGRDPAHAIANELSSCLRETGGSRLVATGWKAPQVSYFEPNATGLFALVECSVPTENGKSVFVEIIVTGSVSDAHATLEQLSAEV
jgi:hypothetical protein